MCPGFGRREFIGFAVVSAASAAVQLRLPATDPTARRALGGGPLQAAVDGAAPAPTVAKPTDETTQKLNALRTKFKVPTTELSDVAGTISADGKTPIGAVAVMDLAAAYAKDTNVSWSKALQFSVDANAHNAADTDPDAGSDSGKAAVLNRALFANASNCLKLCATGILGNAQYTTPNTISGVAGGGYSFPVYPSDMTYIVNGTTNTPGSGQAEALRVLSSALSNRAVVCDYSNFCIGATNSLASTSGGKTPPSQQWAQTLFDARSTTGYQNYLREVNVDDSLRDAEKYWHAKESETLNILNEGLSLRVGAVQASAYLATPFDDMLAGKYPEPVAAYDQAIQHYILAKARATVAGSSSSSVKSVLASFDALLTLFTEKPEDVPGLEQSVAIRNVFMRLTSFEYLGKSSGIFTDDQINEALGAGGKLITDNTTVKAKLSTALLAFNSSGILGSISAVIGVTRLVLESLLLHDAIGKGEVSPAQAIGFTARIVAVYSSFGALRNLTMSFLTAAPTAARTAARILSWNTVSPEMYEMTTGAMWSAARPAADIPTEAQAASTSFAEAMSGTSGKFVDTAEDTVTVFFTQASAEAGAKVPSAQRAVATQALSSAVEAASTRIVEQASIEQGAILAKSSASLASKVFTASLAGAGLIADLLFVSSDIAAIVAGGGMVGASTWLWLVSDGIAVVASGIGVGIAMSLFTASSLNFVALGLTLAAAIIGLIAGAISLPNVAKQTRDEMTATFQRLENDGYLREWGRKIAFMAVYFDALSQEEPVRFVDPSKSLFDVQGKAFEIFATSTGATDWDKFKECRSSLVGVA
ncbi:hypothetical protein [Microbacterium sp. Mcb102]|uniref:hypothetical protein n=1 Tax=Microbacterium sp. Mcb102 TaxID=2926012 RepID=UPI0021C917A1|nr:hypothetical protein [Microbacterium sp. Mcb102]